MDRVKKITAIAIIMALLLPGLLSCASDAGFSLPTRQLTEGEAQSFGSFRYRTFDDGTAGIVEYVGSETSVTIPDSINGATVVELGADAFSSNSALQSVRLNSSLEVIGEYCFYNCTALSEVNIPGRVWSIGLAAFEGTPWLSAQTEEFVIVGDGVLLKYQGGATEVTLPSGILHTSYAFTMNDQLISVRLNDELLTVGSCAFSYCENLRSVEFGERVVLIGDGAFDGCESLTSVCLPDSVVRIGDYAFNYCSKLNEVKLGAAVTDIGVYAFRACMRMKLLELPGTLTSVGEYAFADCYSLLLVLYDGSTEQFETLELSSTNYILRDVEKIFSK